MLAALFEAIKIRLNASDQGPPNGRIDSPCFQQGQGFHGVALYRMDTVISMVLNGFNLYQPAIITAPSRPLAAY